MVALSTKPDELPIVSDGDTTGGEQMKRRQRCDILADVKSRVAGQWPAVLSAVAGIPDGSLDGNHHPCPKCGGTDRFRLIDSDAGAVLCNKCFDRDNGDGLAAIQWALGVDFKAAVDLLANHLHVPTDQPATKKSKAKKDDKPFNPISEGSQDAVIKIFCDAKPPLTVDAVKAAGGIAVHWPKNYQGDGRCIAWPAIDDCGNVTGWILRRVTGKDFPAFKTLSARKTHMLKGSKDGFVIPGGWERIKAAAIVWKVEGVPDALALFPHLPADHAVITNICGAKAVPPYLEPLTGKTLFVVGDADQPGQDGAERYANKLAGIAADVRVVRLPYEVTADSGKDVRDYFLDGGTFAGLMELAEAAEPWTATAEAESKHSDTRQEIIIGPDEHRVIDETVAALSADDELYQRGGALVGIVHEAGTPDGISRPAAAPRIIAVQPATLRERITRFARLLQPGEGDDEFVPAHPRDWQVKGVCHRGQWDGIRSLIGIAQTPVMRPDGSILMTAGYDPATGIFLDAGGLVISVPEHPTRDESQDAAIDLMEVFQDFPFEEIHHSSALLALILTTFGRLAFSGPSPLFQIDANVRGSGKTLLADGVGLIATGDDLPRMSNPNNDEEARKRITALALRGDSICLIDNIGTHLGCPSLDAALTATRWQDRILGGSVIVDMPLSITWIATGNNIILAADTSRRVCPIRLNCKEERPENRQGFKTPDLRQHIRANRGKLVSAALTILRGFHVTGRPQADLPGWGSFESWSALIRQCVVWVGMPDPAGGRIELMERSDVQAGALRMLIESWHEIDPDDLGKTTGELLQMLGSHRDNYPSVREAILELCGGTADKLPAVRTVGNKLRHVRGRIIGGRMLDSQPNRSGAQVWRVCDV